ncbi:putative odorant receptor 92a [Fopius arisanus]|uniref:Odorant receptor 92a n=1 Tax=Fopius arisanus TaxID=64838 RepID=A0A9R1TZI8_9HYME|nr:PREDICTED: putative odorant receptor 92a [Fopius arisanus]
MLGPPCWIPVAMPVGLYLTQYYLIFFGLWVVAFLYSSCDAFIISNALHICGQFEILNMTFDDWRPEESDSNARYRIRKYSKRHNELLLLGNQFNQLVNISILLGIFGNCFIVCSSGIALLISMKNGNALEDVINCVVRIYVGYMSLFMYSYFGEKMFYQAENSRMTAYGCPWYIMPSDIIKDIQFIIMRNNSFCHLTIGGVLIMNYESFKQLTRLMFSSFSILKLMIE